MTGLEISHLIKRKDKVKMKCGPAGLIAAAGASLDWLLIVLEPLFSAGMM